MGAFVEGELPLVLNAIFPSPFIAIFFFLALSFIFLHVSKN
jgi:hypothetical protein